MKGNQRVAAKEPLSGLYRRRSAELQKTFLASSEGPAFLRGRAELVDDVVLSAYRRLLSDALDAPPGFCLAAIGGYGREELCPFSDVDLLLLFERQIGQGVTRAQISEFLRELWDAGLRVGHTVRLLSECGSLDPQNTEFTISLLDTRFLAGDRVLFTRLEEEVVPRVVRREQGPLVKNLTALAELRHKKYGETIYHLEPDVKESPGGLRDYQLAAWLACILRTDEKRMPGRGELPEIALRETTEAHAFLVAARSHLHLLAGRDSNALTFDMQAEVASRSSPHGNPPTPEQWMRLYFRHARTIHRLASQSLRHASAPRSTLSQWFQQRQERHSNEDFAVHGGEVFVRNPIILQRDPARWLDLFEFQARHNLALSFEAERRLQRHLSELEQWAETAGDLWPRLRRILALPHAYTALSSMHELGLLGALFPEFRLIESLVIRDLYHKYTVDEHSLMTIRHIHELAAPPAGSAVGREAPVLARFASLKAELDQPELLLLVLLFHDLGKSAATDHVTRSLELLRPILDRLRLPAEDQDTVRFLVEQHLLMSNTLTSRDTADAATARQFAACVGTSERLRMLTLLTWADIKSVHPGALTPWKEESLWQFYVAAHNELNRQLDADRTSPGEAGAVFRPEVTAFLEGFPRRYLKTHSPPQILAHFRMADSLAADPVQMQLERRQGHYELLVVTGDHPFLFAAITGTLAARGMNIVKAEAFSNRRGIVLDTFRFVDLHRTLELNPEESGHLLGSLRDAILGKTDVGKMLEGRVEKRPLGRTTFNVENVLHFENPAPGSSTLLEVVTRDRPGLLYRVSNVLSAHGCNIEVVLVDTQGHKAIDVFYITRQGAPLDPTWQSAVEKELRRVLEQ